jgi:hypothetical protein
MLTEHFIAGKSGPTFADPLQQVSQANMFVFEKARQPA